MDTGKILLPYGHFLKACFKRLVNRPGTISVFSHRTNGIYPWQSPQVNQHLRAKTKRCQYPVSQENVN
ncbi:hypothetical protein GDO81_017992 [Engystomops pustulosus]|uniref:Uncharacterized protein n=1 Tax=Engystomops pustulosus TaxID=76066 RepID=A0AAV7AC69_ENGPU|nr:hypothetical protein GDO81_017992 [Engystomops pustulosus]